jgi:hypothetical protein
LATIKPDAVTEGARRILMVEERRQHLEVVAASLTQSYYTVHTAGSPDHRDIVETYFFFLEALVTHDDQKPGQTPLTPGDTLAPFEAAHRDRDDLD